MDLQPSKLHGFGYPRFNTSHVGGGRPIHVFDHLAGAGGGVLDAGCCCIDDRHIAD